MMQLYTALVTTGISYECLGDEDLGLKDGDVVVVKCERYLDNATISGKIGEPIQDVEEFERLRSLNSKGRHIEGAKIPIILRKATEEDNAKAEENKIKAVEAHNQTRERIMAHGLEMKLIHTHYALDRKLLLFQFSADGRIDFRELLRDLSTLFRIRVELRQIGGRDESALLGGIGICGRPFCCKAFLTSFNSINVRMAKQQGISLNPQNISGCCGRLKCCLYYEADAYKDVPLGTREKGQMPDEDVDEKELAALDAKEAVASSTQEVDRPRQQHQQQNNAQRQNRHRDGQRSRDNQNQGERNQGERNQGERNQGERNQGERKQGERKQGERNQGDMRRQNQQGGRPPRSEFGGQKHNQQPQQHQHGKQVFRPNRNPGPSENKKQHREDEKQ